MRTVLVLLAVASLPLTLAAVPDGGPSGPQGLDLAALDPALPVAVGEMVGGACVTPPVKGYLLPGNALVLSQSPTCEVYAEPVPCTLPLPACAEAYVAASPQAPAVDSDGLVACLKQACGLPPLHTPEPDLAMAPLPSKVNCADYAMHATVNTGDTEVRNALVWEAGCGVDPMVFYGQGQCLVHGAGPQPGSWVLSSCPHLHDWSGWEVAHETTGNFHHVHASTQATSGHHSNMAGVHGDGAGNHWCTFSLQFNPHSSILTALCGPGPL